MIQRRKNEKIVFIVVFVIFLLYALALLYPFYFALTSALKENGRVFMSDPVSFPIPPFVKNFYLAIKELNTEGNNFLMMTFNSFWYSAGCTALGIFSSSLAAYVVCKYNFKLKKFFYGLTVFIMIIPIYGALPATYKLFAKLGMLNNMSYIFSAASGFGFSFIILYAFFKGLSWNFAEAAFIDGAGHYMIFFKIMLPMALPSVTAIAIMNFVGYWNDYETPLLFLSKMPTLASGLWLYERKIMFTANHPVYFAGVLLSLLPIVTIFIVFQNTIMQNVYAGGLKG